jgi:hypothetical protein
VQLFVITLTFRSCTKHDQNFLIIYLNPSWFDVFFFFVGNYDAHPWALQPWSSHVWEAEKFPVNLEQNKHGRTSTCQEFMLKDEPVDSMHNVVLNFYQLWLLQYLSACHAILLSAQFRSLRLLYSGFKLKISWAPKLPQIYLCFSSSLLILWCWYGELILSFFMWKLRTMFVSQIVHCDQMWDSRCWMGLEHICDFSWLALTRRMQRYTAIRLRIAMIKPMHSKSFWQRFTTISNPLWIIVPYVSPYDDCSSQSWAYDLHFKFCDPSTFDATLQCSSSWV